MTRHTILTTVHNRPGALSRTITLLDQSGVAFATLAVGRSSAMDALRLTIAVDAAAASHVVRQLGGMADVIDTIDMSAAMRMERRPGAAFSGDFREQADGAPHEAAA